MTFLADEYSKLVQQGLITPAVVAPHFEPLHIPTPQRSRVVYNVGEALIQEEDAHAKLGPSSTRNTINGRAASQSRGWVD